MMPLPPPRNRTPRLHRALPLALVAVGVAFLLNAACAPLYTPNPIHTPVAEKRGEVHAAAYAGTGIYSFNGSVSLTNHLMLLGSYSFDPGTLDTADEMMHHLSHSFGEVGAGWYTRPSKRLRLEILGGYGFGRTSASSRNSLDGITYQEYVYRVEGEYHRIFLQGNLATRKFGGRTEDEREAPNKAAGLALRASYLWFDELRYDSLPPIDPSAIFFEPIFFIRDGPRNVQAEMQVGVPLKVPLGEGSFSNHWLHFNIGVHIILDGLW